MHMATRVLFALFSLPTFILWTVARRNTIALCCLLFDDGSFVSPACLGFCIFVRLIFHQSHHHLLSKRMSISIGVNHWWNGWIFCCKSGEHTLLHTEVSVLALWKKNIAASGHDRIQGTQNVPVWFNCLKAQATHSATLCASPHGDFLWVLANAQEFDV